jgi:hypothetical protein
LHSTPGTTDSRQQLLRHAAAARQHCVLCCAMAGLAIDVRFSEEPAARRDWLRSAYRYSSLCLFHGVKNAPGDSEMPQDDFRITLKVVRTNAFWVLGAPGPVTSPPHVKKIVKTGGIGLSLVRFRSAAKAAVTGSTVSWPLQCAGARSRRQEASTAIATTFGVGSPTSNGHFQ